MANLTPHQRTLFNDLMRSVYNALNDDSIPVVEILMRLENGNIVSYTPGHEYRSPEDIAKEKAENEQSK